VLRKVSLDLIIILKPSKKLSIREWEKRMGRGRGRGRD